MPNHTRQPEPRPRGKISVIIPVWRDEAALASVLAIFCPAPEVAEVIVSLAENDAAISAVAAEWGAVCVQAGGPNRGRQLDRGAAQATGEWLLFHHADTSISPTHLHALAALHADAAVVGGAFYRRFDERHPWLRSFECVERWHNRTFGALYGDQSIFVLREVFNTLGGFRNLPIMEDVDFSLRMRGAGKILLLDPPIASSPRRHLARGPWRTTLMNAWLLFLFHCGVHPERLHRRYYLHGAGGAVAERGACAAPEAILP